MEHFMQIAQYQRDHYSVLVDIADEYVDITDSDPVVLAKIKTGELEWFILRVRVFADTVLLSSVFKGSLLYDNATRVLSDGVAESLIEIAITKAAEKMHQLNLIS